MPLFCVCLGGAGHGGWVIRVTTDWKRVGFRLRNSWTLDRPRTCDEDAQLKTCCCIRFLKCRLRKWRSSVCFARSTTFICHNGDEITRANSTPVMTCSFNECDLAYYLILYVSLQTQRSSTARSKSETINQITNKVIRALFNSSETTFYSVISNEWC